MVIKNNVLKNMEDSSIHTTQFISYINQQSLEHLIANEIISDNNISIEGIKKIWILLTKSSSWCTFQDLNL
ncbi:16040_t:CDS:2, partial [Dentiscutata heterogama]